MLKGIVNLVGGGFFHFLPGSKYSVDADSFTERTVHKFYCGPGHFVFVQGSRIKSVEVWKPYLTRLLIALRIVKVPA